MIVQRCHRKCLSLPPPVPGMERVSSMKILGLTIQHNLSMSEHVNNVISSAGQQLYALKTLKSHGLPFASLSDVCRSTLIAHLTYAASAWVGFTNSADLQRPESVVHRAQKWGLYSNVAPTLEGILNAADTKLFNAVPKNDRHVLHPLC